MTRGEFRGAVALAAVLLALLCFMAARRGARGGGERGNAFPDAVMAAADSAACTGGVRVAADSTVAAVKPGSARGGGVKGSRGRAKGTKARPASRPSPLDDVNSR